MNRTPELAASRLAEIKMTQDLLTKEADELKAFLLDALDPDQEIEAQNTGFVRVIYRKGSTTKREYAPRCCRFSQKTPIPTCSKPQTRPLKGW
jgi:hypothetical protein